MSDLVTVPPAREKALRRALGVLDDAERIVLTTHVNADGDGAGSEAAMSAWLTRRDRHVTIVNPTPFPKIYEHLIEAPERLAAPTEERGREAAKRADLFVVLDTSEPTRIGRVLKLIGERPVLVLDHHPPAEPSLGDGAGVRDPEACATGELVYDLLRVAGTETWPRPVVDGLYTAIVTDTGSFRFSNTGARTHRLAADLIRRGVDPEATYRRLFATVPRRRLELLRIALGQLRVDPEAPITWITVRRAVMDELGATSDDLDGVVDHARSVEGTEVALLFRETADGATKISFRSNGAVDVNTLARKFGGGGHAKAAGALVGQPLETVRDEVLVATRDAVRVLETLRTEQVETTRTE